MNSVWSISEIRRLIYSFDNTFHEIFRECLHDIKKKGFYNTFWFTDGHGHNVDYKIVPCIKNHKNQCKGELIVQAPGNHVVFHLPNGSYHVMDDGWVSSFGSDGGNTYSCFDLDEFDGSLQKQLQSDVFIASGI
jgi:hypothetical protein